MSRATGHGSFNVFEVVTNAKILHVGVFVSSGIKIDMRKHRKKLRRLGNQFKPFNDVFGCDLRPESMQDSYNATLFRFPLRTKSQVRPSVCHSV